jgi:glycosyltransferase involved in cell wall biosynthesis
VGGGTRLKIYEAMAMECAVVSTTVGAEGLPVTDGEEIVRADDAAAFADAVVTLLEDPARARRLGAAAARRVHREFGWEHAGEEFVRLCERAAAGERRPDGASARAAGPGLTAAARART